MKARRAHFVAPFAIIGVICASAGPAPAQLPGPVGSLIVSITSPTSGSTVRNTTPVNASVSIIGSLTVADVTFYVDGNAIGTDTTNSYSVSWDTRGVGNGSHTLTAAARDNLGVRWSSNPVTVTVANDITPPSVTINQASTQADPTSSAPIVFTAVFSEAVSGFTGTDVAIGGTALGTKTVSVSGGPNSYTVTVSGMTSSGTVIATIPAGRATDAAGNGNTASTSTDNTVMFTAADPTVTRFEEGAPTYAGTWFAFSDAQTGVVSSNGTVGGSSVAGSTATFTFTGTGISWIGFPCEVCGIANVYLDDLTVPVATVDTFATTRPSTTMVLFSRTGLTSETHTLRIEVTGTKNASSGDIFVVVDAFDVTSGVSGSADTTPPTVHIDQASTQADPTSNAPILFTAVFSEPVNGFTGSNVAIGGTAGGTKTVSVSGGPSKYTVAVSGMTGSGTVIATIQAGPASDSAGNPNTASTSTDNTVTFNAPATAAPSVTIDQASTQADPTSSAPVLFTAVFSEGVTGFTGSDVAIGGTAGGTKTVTVSGGPSTYTVAVSGMTTDGTVIATIPAGVASDPSGNPNAVSTSTDNTVTFRAAGRFEEGTATYAGTWLAFSDAQTGVVSSNGTVGGSSVAGSTATFTFTGTGISWIGFPCEVCGIANVYLDDLTVPVATVDTFATTRPSATMVLFSRTGLTSETHTLRIEVTGTKNGSSSDFFVIVDAFDVTTDASGSADTTPPPVHILAATPADPRNSAPIFFAPVFHLGSVLPRRGGSRFEDLHSNRRTLRTANESVARHVIPRSDPRGTSPERHWERA